MSLHSMLVELLARPAPEQRAARLLDAVLWRALLGLSVIFLLVAFWRVLEGTLGPILAPLVMAFALAVMAFALALIEARRKRHIKETTPSLAPVVATVLEIAFAPKAVRWFALGSMIYDIVTGQSPLTSRPLRSRRS